MRKEDPMKKLIFVLVIFCLCFAGAVGAKEICKYKEGDLILVVNEPAATEKQTVWDVIFSTTTTATEKSTGRLANGVSCTYVGVGGNSYRVASYKNGKLDGTVKLYHKNGKLESEAPYKNGRAEGIRREYYESGKLRKETPYKNGKPEGIEKSYYESGKLQKESSWENGMPKDRRTYYESGRLQEEFSWENGMPKDMRTYYESGRLRMESVGKEEKTYYESGKLKSEVALNAVGMREGLRIIYTESGSLWGGVFYRLGEIVRGTCADGRDWTNAEIINWQNGHTVICD